MSQTATQDEDILIISDDSATADSDIFLEESVDASPSDGQETPVKLSIPTLWDDSIQSEEMIITEDTKEQTWDISLDFDISTDESQKSVQDLWSSEVEISFDTPVQNISEETKDETTNEFDFSNLSQESTVSPISEEVSQTGEEKKEEESFVTPTVNISSVQEESVSDGSNLNEILAGTIAKLTKRQEVIASDKAAKTSQVQDLKDQIAKLEEEVALHESEVESLDVENDKISKNITQLEKMKLGDEEITREHNAKRVAKK